MHKVVQKRCISFLWFGPFIARHWHLGHLLPPWARGGLSRSSPFITHSNPFEKKKHFCGSKRVKNRFFHRFCPSFWKGSVMFMRRCVFRGGNPPLIRAANGISGHLRCCTEPDQRHLQKFHPATAPVKSSDAWRLSCGVSLASWILRVCSKRIQTAVTGIALGKYTDQIMDQLDMVKICEIQKEKHL